MVTFDPFLFGSVTFLLTALSFIVFRIIKLHLDETNAHRRTEALIAMAKADARDARQERQQPVVVGGRRHAATRRRFANDEDFGYLAAVAAGDLSNESGEENDSILPIGDETVGKKKLAKLQAKANRKAQREAEIVEREERKKREEEREKEREKHREEEERKEAEEEERKKKEKEEREKKEHEEYLKLKQDFEVNEEGFDQVEEEESQNLMKDFVEYIRKAKIVNMDELASHFQLRTGEAIERVKSFMDDGTLTGVIDERGKFIYITEDEMQAVAKFISQRGRISITELAEYSNRLIHLEPEAEPSVA